MSKRTLDILGFLVLAAAVAVRLLPEPDKNVKFTCPNHSGACDDTTAVTFGYVR